MLNCGMQKGPAFSIRFLTYSRVMAVKTLNDIYLHTLQVPRETAMLSRRDGRWQALALGDFGERVRHLSLALRAEGIKENDRVAILSENRPEWAIADFAILAAGAVTVPIYPTLLGWQVEYILNDSGA